MTERQATPEPSDPLAAAREREEQMIMMEERAERRLKRARRRLEQANSKLERAERRVDNRTQQLKEAKTELAERQRERAQGSSEPDPFLTTSEVAKSTADIPDDEEPSTQSH